MKVYFFQALGLCGMVLQVMVIAAMARGPFRKFPGVFFYLLVLFLTSVADMAAFLNLGSWPEWYEKYFYVNNTIRQFSVYAAVISLIISATAQRPRRSALYVKLIAGTALVVLLSFLFSEGPGLGMYMTKVSRNLSFAALILNVILWFSLIRVRLQDRRLFLVSGGLGLNMAGEAIGQSLLQISGRTVLLGSLIIIGSHLLCLSIWWTAFRHGEEQVHLRTGVSSR